MSTLKKQPHELKRKPLYMNAKTSGRKEVREPRVNERKAICAALDRMGVYKNTKWNGASKISDGQKRNYRRSKPLLPPRAKVTKFTTKLGAVLWDAWTIDGPKQTFVRRYDTQEEAMAAAEKFLADGIKPEPKYGRESGALERDAKVKKPRKNKDGSLTYEVHGRDGKGKDAKKGIYVGSFPSLILAEEAVERFKATGETIKIDRGSRATAPGVRSSPKPKPEVTTAPAARDPRVLDRMERYLAKYGKGY